MSRARKPGESIKKYRERFNNKSKSNRLMCRLVWPARLGTCVREVGENTNATEKATFKVLRRRRLV